MPVLTRAWQLLLKGLREVKDSPRPLAAADMVLVRIGFFRRSADPDEALRKLALTTSGEAPEVPQARGADPGARGQSLSRPPVRPWYQPRATTPPRHRLRSPVSRMWWRSPAIIATFK